MYSNLTKTNYDIKDMNLQELRDRIINENNITPLDILKGFHAKSKVTLEYTSCLTEQNLKDIQLIQQKYKSYIEKECKENLQKIYDTQFNKLLDESKNNCPDFSPQTIIDYKNNKYSLSSDLRHECFDFLRKIRNISLKEKIETLAKEYIKSYIEEKFGDTYTLCSYHSDRFENLPRYLDINSEINIDFSQVYENYTCNGDFSEWDSFDYNSYVENSDSHIKFYKYDMIGISVHLSESKVKEMFDNTINSIIYNNNSIGEIEFFQNLESQPITININTKTNKYELIDGYKRLLYITDEKLLKHSAPIKIFTDLNDVEFLTILYSSNVWKCEKDFHDRGFLFALKIRFGFTIPSHVYKDNFTNELEIIQLYDFGGNLVRVDKSKLMNTLMLHKHLSNDMKLMYNFLSLESRKYKYDDNMSDEIMFTIIELVGELRRLSDSNTQNELSEELITSIFEDSFVKELCSKKHLSTRTYVINYFRDKKIYKHISEILNKNIRNESIGEV